MPPDDDYKEDELDKLASLGSLAGGIAHDLNNLLTGVLGHVSFLRLLLTNEGPHADSLTAIEDGARRAATMTQQILAFAREDQAGLKPVNLAHIVVAGVNLLRGALPKNITVRVVDSDKEFLVNGHESRLSQLFMNLAINARDALPGGGVIEIKLGRVMLDEEYCRRRDTLAPGEYVRLCISDNGTGMTPEVRKRIFERFFTTKATEGTGLGLATVFSIVQSHKACIDVQSEEGIGTRFEVFFPPCRRKQVPAETTKSVQLPVGSERVLVVDDEDIVRTIIQRSLEHLGYKVEVAEDGLDAIERFRSERDGFNLVILDMMMPKMAGEEVFSELRAIDPAIRVILVSGYSSKGRAKKVLDAGAMGFIQKPFAVEELALEVRRCLDV